MNELVKYQTDHGDIELSPSIIRQYLVPKDTQVSDQEVLMFLKLCEYQKLNPFTREIYLVKYGNYPASFVTGKEVFTKRAMNNPAYAGLKAGITIQLKNGTVERREGSLSFPGETIVGGWASVYIKGYTVPMFDEVSLAEYIGKKSDGTPTKMWHEKPATMIRKVAIVHALREAFPKDFEGLYSQEEISHIDTSKLPVEPVKMIESAGEPEAKDVTPSEPAEAAMFAPRPEPEQKPEVNDVNSLFLVNVQYVIKKIDVKTSKSGKTYNKYLISENGINLELIVFEPHNLVVGDALVIEEMKPIESREWKGQMYYSTVAQISQYNATPKESVEEQYPLPFDI